MTEIAEYINGLPNICGQGDTVAEAVSRPGPVYLGAGGIDFDRARSAYAIALHMHQPLIPAGSDDLRSAEIISNLQHMMAHPNSGDNHNATVFHWCYKRMGEFIPQLLEAGKQPRVMLDYSGTLLHGLRKMGLDDVFENLRTITCDPRYRHCVEWLGTTWGHAVAPSTPVQDFRLHVQAWQHFFAAIFGLEAVGRVRGFSPSEMALPNHPDVAYEFVKTLKDHGYRWVLVQEHTVEHLDGGPLQAPHRPHRLITRNSSGQSVSITAIIKTQGSDTKLVGQMQPYYEAKGLGRITLNVAQPPSAGDAGRGLPTPKQSTPESGSATFPSLVTQIADGENGGVMMNEFPGKYQEAIAESSGTETPAVNVTEYLEYLDTLGVREEDFPAIQPIMQHRIWERFDEGAGPETMAHTIAELEAEGDRFHVEGGSWTNNISWVRGYDDVLKPMERVSALFAKKVLTANVPTSDPRYRDALYHLLITQTSCYRYWGEGLWADYGRELCRRAEEVISHDF